jgi:CRP-like cAMP-binding protein
VLEGTVKIYKDRYRIRSLGEGECFGEISYLKGAPATATVTANGDVMLWCVEPGFLDGVSSATQLGFYKAFLEMVIERLSRGNRDIARLQDRLYALRSDD